MAKIYVDNIEYEVPDGKNMLEACTSLGLDLPYFCWHPKMHSVGACRQCAVMSYRDENDTRGRITMACMLDANDGTRISINAQPAKDFRAGNIESLMINHPHDCAVCDEGGECHLQDMTVMSGHNYRRYRFQKRTHNNQDLGPFINHEMNRCIQCYRCVRFYNDYAGGGDFGVFASSGRVYFGRSEEGTLESEFSGNLVEVCPTGVFTDKTLHKHYTRKWDLTSAPSICQGCSVGCNILTSERYGKLRRVMTRFNGDVNGYFLCDRGRFGYEYVNDEQRLTRAAQKDQNSGTDAFSAMKDHLASNPKLIGIGSPRASLESNFLLKQLVGADNFYNGVSAIENEVVNEVLNVLVKGNVRTPSLAEIETYDTVFVLGEDVTNTSPMIALALRQAAKNLPKEKAFALKIQHWNDAAIREVVQDEKGPFYLATPYATKLEEIATSSVHGNTKSLVQLSSKVADLISKGGDHQEDNDFAYRVANALTLSKKPLIVSGCGMMSKEIIRCAANIAGALRNAGKEVGVVFSVPEVNSLGMALLGSAGSLDDAILQTEKESGMTSIVLETDLFFRTNSQKANSFFEHSGKTILIDSLENNSTPNADFILPAGTFAESSGTMINNEGRAQRFYQVFKPNNDIKSSWAWLDMLMHQAEKERNFDAIVEEMANSVNAFQPISGLAPHADFRIGTQKIPRASHRFSGRTSMNADVNVHEPKPPVDEDSPLSFTMEGYHGKAPSSDIPFFWSPGWNSVQSINKYQIEVGGPLHGGNPGIRLIEPSESGVSSFEVNDGSADNGKIEALPSWFIFGSGELTAKSQAIMKRIEPAIISVSSATLKNSGIEGNGKITINSGEQKLTLPYKVDENVPAGVVLIPYGLADTMGITFPIYGNISMD
ncbi:MAG: NADH-quinone oxidoreductase subunit NuoG [Saprospiraceae bacterium]|nr:NADH-quinone oxidoreductase subunit NuoG [Saprospiraceae bacterium]